MFDEVVEADDDSEGESVPTPDPTPRQGETQQAVAAMSNKPSIPIQHQPQQQRAMQKQYDDEEEEEESEEEDEESDEDDDAPRYGSIDLLTIHCQCKAFFPHLQSSRLCTFGCIQRNQRPFHIHYRIQATANRVGSQIETIHT